MQFTFTRNQLVIAPDLFLRPSTDTNVSNKHDEDDAWAAEGDEKTELQYHDHS